MNIVLKREVFTDESTIGSLSIDGTFFCYTLEDKVRTEKIKHITAIPAGRYEVVISYSNRFGQQMPLLLNVPGFEGVRIHWGNKAADSSGCVLLGTTKAKDFIGASRAAYAKFMAKLKTVSKTEKIYIEIA